MFDWLLNSHIFITREHCGQWNPWLITVNQFANMFIFLAYTFIPLSLFNLWLTVRKDERMNTVIAESFWIILMFVVFILSCGLTHLCDVLAFSWAPYRLFTAVDVVTAACSVPTAILLPGVLRKILNAK